MEAREEMEVHIVAGSGTSGAGGPMSLASGRGVTATGGVMHLGSGEGTATSSGNIIIKTANSGIAGSSGLLRFSSGEMASINCSLTSTVAGSTSTGSSGSPFLGGFLPSAALASTMAMISPFIKSKNVTI